MTKTKIINLFGGPGSGKSTTASGLFYRLKKAGVNVELINEYAKEIVWEETTALISNQLHIFAEQFRRQYRLVDKVDYVITDSPIILSTIYLQHHYNQGKIKLFDDEHLKLTTKYFIETNNLFDNINYFIVRNKVYNPVGRLQTETESDHLSQEIFNFLKNNDIGFNLTNSNTSVEDIINEEFPHLK